MGIELKGISKSWHQQQILHKVSFKCDAGETLVLLGPSGAGKSSLLRLMNLLDTPDEGELLIAGERFAFPEAAQQSDYTKRTQLLRGKVGMVFQQYHLWPHLTVEQNLLEAPLKVLGMNRSEAVDKAGYLLSQLKLAEKRTVWPASLSGGQQQRVAIARALMMDPAILLFDEPTSALDPELQQEVVKVIKDLAGEHRTMILVTHDMRLAADVSDHVVFLHQGRIEEEGPPDQVFGAPKSERLRQFLSATMAV